MRAVRASAPPTATIASSALSSPSPSPCGKLDIALADSKMPLLVDRLTVQVPKVAVDVPRSWDVMSAPKPAAEETRLMIGGGRSFGTAPGDDALVVVARETWQLDPATSREPRDAVARAVSFDDEAPKFLRTVYGADEIELDVERTILDDASIRAYAARPREPRAAEGADSALVLALLLALPDATLQSIAFYVSPWLAKDRGCTAAAERIAATIEVGSRKLERSAGVRELHELSSSASLAVTVPEDYVAVHQPGPDFDVYRLYKLRPLGSFPGTLTISVEAHPDRAISRGSKREKGKLLGRAVEWRAARSSKGGTLEVTQPLSPDGAPGRGRGQHLQIVVNARQEKYLDAFKRVAETLAIKKH